VSPLERHCQLLLRVYPAAYREIRGEEIIGTLLEATPPERSWPWPRDSRGLIFGGLRARAAFNRQLTTGANLRTALLAGTAAYLAYNAAAIVGYDVGAELRNGGQHFHPVPVDWPQLLACALILVTVLLAWLSRRRMVVLAGTLPAGAAATWIAGTSHPDAFGETVVSLVSLAALVALSGNSEPRSRRWLVAMGVIALVPLVLNVEPHVGLYVFETLQLTVAAAAILWAVIDARPVVAVSVFILGLWLPYAVGNLTQGFTLLYLWPYLAITTLIAVPAVWLLRRQSSHAGRPTKA
jgi:hypothetical protein